MKAIKAYQISSELGKKIKIGNSVLSSHMALKARGFEPGYTKLPLMINYDDKDRISIILQYIDEALLEINKLEA